ncbi:MAG: hypothetical protein J6Z43_10470 [Clostridiales bacterium]|nr:hypothetical protein [Clostridiales bacterium]
MKDNNDEAIQLNKEHFSLRLYKTDLSVDQWARLCLLFSSIDEVLREDEGPLDWKEAS